MGQVLVVAAHPDDEVLGCGGTIRRHTKHGDQVKILFMGSGVAARGQISSEQIEARKEMALRAADLLGADEPVFCDFPDNGMDSVPLLTVVSEIESLMSGYRPDTVYTHSAGDLNIDHRVTHQAVMTACRPMPECSVMSVLCFEVVSSTDWAFNSQPQPFRPVHFVEITETLETKVAALEAYGLEMRDFPHPRSEDNVRALALNRGATVGFERAEGFEVSYTRIGTGRLFE